MRNFIFIIGMVSVIYGCAEISGKEPASGQKIVTEPAIMKGIQTPPPEGLRVGRDEAMEMRGRRQKDDATFKISASDLQSLITNAPSANDSFIFYLVKYDVKSEKEKQRYLRKNRYTNWNDIGKKPSTVLVGFLGGSAAGTMHLAGRQANRTVSVYDLAVLCPPPPDCACDIEQ